MLQIHRGITTAYQENRLDRVQKLQALLEEFTCDFAESMLREVNQLKHQLAQRPPNESSGRSLAAAGRRTRRYTKAQRRQHKRQQ